MICILMIMCGLAINFCGAISSLWSQPLLFVLLVSDIVATVFCIKISSILYIIPISLDILLRIMTITLIVFAFMFLWDIPHLIQKTYFPYISNLSTYLERYFQRGGALMWFNVVKNIFSAFISLFKKNINKNIALEHVLVSKQKNIPFRLTYGLYVYYILITEGILVSLLLAGSFIWIIFNSTYTNVFILMSFITIFTALSMISWRAARGSIILRPLIAILAGIFLSGVSDLLGELFYIFSITAIGIYGIINNIKYLKLTFPFRDAVDFVKSYGIPKMIPLNYHLASVYYKEEDIINALSTPLNEILEYIKRGELKYIIIDVLGRNFYKHLTWIDEIEKTEPVFKRDNPCVTEPSLFAEIELLYPPYGNNLEFKLNPSETEREVRVYDLEKFFFTAEQINEQGEALYIAGNHEAAEKKFKTAIEMKPDFVSAYNNLGVLLWETKQSDSSLDYLHNAINIDPTNYESVFNFVTITVKCKKIEKMKEILPIIKNIRFKEEDIPGFHEIINKLDL